MAIDLVAIDLLCTYCSKNSLAVGQLHELEYLLSVDRLKAEGS